MTPLADTCAAAPRTLADAPPGALSESSFPDYWQQRALTAWENNARRGVIGTGSDAGKAFLGVSAAISSVLRDRTVLIVVPDELRRRQWLATLEQDFSTCTAASFDPDACAPSQSPDVWVLTAEAAATLTVSHKFALLVADECLEAAAALLRSPPGSGCTQVLGLVSALPPEDSPGNDSGAEAAPSSILGGVVHRRTASGPGTAPAAAGSSAL